MAKKPTKKEAPAAKAKKVAKPAAKETKTAKAASSAKASAAKPAKAVAAKAAPKASAKVAPKAAPKAAAKPASKTPAKPAAKPAKATADEKKPKANLALVKEPEVEADDEVATVEAPVAVKKEKEKKEKKAKVTKASKAEKAGAADDQAKWSDLHERYKTTKAVSYSISGQFEAKTPLQHKIFGWGYILSNEYDRLEVLFEDGKRMLISNRKLS